MELSYQECGMRSRFILTTIGDYRGSSATPAPSGGHRSAVDTASDSRRHQASEPTSFAQNSFGAMLPPAEPASRSFTREPQNQRIQRPSPPPPRPSLNPESLFLPADEDEDRQWGERTYGEDEDTLGWSASAVRVSSPILNTMRRVIDERPYRLQVLEILKKPTLVKRGLRLTLLGQTKSRINYRLLKDCHRSVLEKFGSPNVADQS